MSPFSSPTMEPRMWLTSSSPTSCNAACRSDFDTTPVESTSRNRKRSRKSPMFTSWMLRATTSSAIFLSMLWEQNAANPWCSRVTAPMLRVGSVAGRSTASQGSFSACTAVGRSLIVRDNNDLTSAITSEDISDQYSAGNSNGAFMMCLNVSVSVSPKKGTVPDNMMYNKIPLDQTSHFAVYFFRKTSGAMYIGVPSAVVRVSPGPKCRLVPKSTSLIIASPRGPGD
mmetsp:Transcript_129293/g.374384  ORF Transcript_129293/g.374384 Transcript_129293/m.374384 type:complete len:227 (-) Transcript_129293:605-1285(-)